MKSTEERLQELLDQKDREIEQLRSDVSTLSRKLANAELTLEHCTEDGWAVSGMKCLPDPSLPVPRLELAIRYQQRQEENETIWYYRIVFRHWEGHLVCATIGHTRGRGYSRQSPVDEHGRLELPLRDGVHIHHDMAHFNLPGFVVWNDRVEQLDGSHLRNGGDEVFERGRRHRQEGRCGQ